MIWVIRLFPTGRIPLFRGENGLWSEFHTYYTDKEKEEMTLQLGERWEQVPSVMTDEFLPKLKFVEATSPQPGHLDINGMRERGWFIMCALTVRDVREAAPWLTNEQATETLCEMMQKWDVEWKDALFSYIGGRFPEPDEVEVPQCFVKDDDEGGQK